MLVKTTSLFDTWMLQESDTVQGLATAFAERVVLERMRPPRRATKDSTLLHALRRSCLRVQEDLGWF